MGGRGSGGGKNSGGSASNKDKFIAIDKINEKEKVKITNRDNLHDEKTIELINKLENNLKNINRKLKEKNSFEKRQQLANDELAIRDQIKYYKKTDKIKYINKYGGSNIQDWESYSAKDINKMFNQVQKGKKMKKIGYEWVVDYNS